jgi:hypothetical protein
VSQGRLAGWLAGELRCQQELPCCQQPTSFDSFLNFATKNPSML